MSLLLVICNFIAFTFIGKLTLLFITCFIGLVFVRRVGFAFLGPNSEDSNF